MSRGPTPDSPVASASDAPLLHRVEVGRPSRDVAPIDLIASHLQHAEDVADVLVGAAFTIVLQLLDDHVLGRSEPGGVVRRGVDAHGATQPLPVEGRVRGDDHVELEPGRGVQDVALEPGPHGLRHGGLEAEEIRLGECPAEGPDLLRRQVDDDVDIVREARLALGRGRHRPGDEIRDS